MFFLCRKLTEGLTTMWFPTTSPVITVMEGWHAPMKKKSGFCHFAFRKWANRHKAGSWVEPVSLIWPQWHVWLVRAGVGGCGRLVCGEGSPLLWQWRTNINLLQQSIFHHTYSQGTSQSGLYPFCQWLPSSINFIENYTPDRCSSRPLSICRGLVEVELVGRRGWAGLSGVCVPACSQRSDSYFWLAARSCPDNSHRVVQTKQCFSSPLTPFFFLAVVNENNAERSSKHRKTYN